MRLVLEGGGVRAAYTSGVLKQFEDAGVDVSSVVGASTGSMVAAYFAAGQMDSLLTVWREFIPGTRVMNYGRLFLPTKRPSLDMDYLVDEVMCGTAALDLHKATTGKPALYMVASDVERHQLVVSKPDATNVLTWMKASAALPVGYNKIVEIGPYRLMDGGLIDSVPFAPTLPDAPACDGPTVVLVTRPIATYKPAPAWWIRLFIRSIVPAQARTLVLDQHNTHNRLMHSLDEARERGDVLVIEPPADMPLKRLTRDRATIEHGIAVGIETGKRVLEQLR